MKLTIKLDGTREIEGTPEELREFEAAQVPLHVGPAMPVWLVPHPNAVPLYTPPCTCGQTTACAAHPFGVWPRFGGNVCGGNVNCGPTMVVNAAEWKPVPMLAPPNAARAAPVWSWSDVSAGPSGNH